ncbi:MAG TPA: OmpA family protein [Gemmatimonadales bacterium]|jgi:outer membrane protein OmpA-like peptidoglycan-associated protein
MLRCAWKPVLVLFLAISLVSPVRAQNILQRARDRARQGVADRVNNTSDAAVDSALAHGDRQVRCIMGDTTCVRKVRAAGRQVVMTDSAGSVMPNQSQAIAASTAPAAAPAATTDNSSSGDAGAAAPSAPPGAGAWLNYDFVPGDRVIWWEDFSGDEVGDFPRRMQLVNGNFEVVNVGGHKYLRSVEGGQILIVLPEALPSQFTMEVRYYSPSVGNPLAVQTSGGDNATWGCYHGSGWVMGGGGMATSSQNVDDIGEHDFVNCRFTISDRYIKAYLNEHRVANVPTTNVARTDSILITIPSADQNDPTLITDIRIAAGGRKLYDALAANGRVATQGILFDTGSDHIRGESTPTLKEIGDMLTQHADLKLTIEGHTDNVGAAAANQSLSERRAAAVRQYLIDQFHIDASRLNSAGFGASHPAAPNTTPEGRQTNRRVELVRIP